MSLKQRNTITFGLFCKVHKGDIYAAQTWLADSAQTFRLQALICQSESSGSALARFQPRDHWGLLSRDLLNFPLRNALDLLTCDAL